MNYKNLANSIIKCVGGKENIQDITHCATRLRFRLNDFNIPNEQEIEELKGVASIVTYGGQFQVVIGPDVSKVYKEAIQILDIKETLEVESNEEVSIASKEKSGVMNKIMAYVSAAITPLILPLLGSSIIKVILTILLQYEFLTYESGTYAVLAAASNAVFTFLPVLCAITCARYLKCNQFIAACIGGALMEPTLTALADTTIQFIGVPIHVFNYSSTVFPAMVAIGLYAISEHWLDRKIHSEIMKTFVLPTVGLLIFVPITIMLFGPFSYYLGEGILWLYHTIYNISPILLGIIFGGTFWFSVAFGLHWALVPIVVADLASGSSPLAGIYITGNICMWGVALGMIWASRSKAQRAEFITHFFTVCVAGVTEPFLYGYVLKSKKMMATCFVGGAIGGGLFAMIHNAGLAYTYTNIFTVPTLWVNDNYILYIVFVLVTVAIGMILTRYWASKDILNDE